MDSQWNQYDGMTAQTLLRTLLGNGEPDGLIPLNDAITTAVETANGTKCSFIEA